MLQRQQSSSACLNWQFLFVGLFSIIMQCNARAVNVSNTWTMPQEGLNVFYRFFRDRISWFEADAVCQFHHANLVTVDNSFQFDATRDLLRELDVNDIVWIGLMRPQSSDRFMWSSNSRPLVADTGYWAESLPLMDAPLCAVIDPIRDYRWHALRCGGPETASFLCEMPVPSWADACNLKDMPHLTLQYMADTASIELIRNCQEEGLLRTMCRGKQDRERAMQDLICPRERLEAQRINDITNSHFKSLQIINSIPSDNNENNDIELLPLEVNYGPHYPEELQTEKNTVQRLIEQFNVDELMQADEPSNMETVSNFYKIPGLIPKPVKKSGKKLPDFNKNSKSKDKVLLEEIQKIKKPLNMDDIMMGDQPSMQGEPEMPEQLLNEEVSNEILEPLPHIKKTNIHKEDMEKMEKEAIALKKNMLKTKEMETKKMLMKMASTTTTTTSTTTEQPKTSINPVILTSTTEKPLTTIARESNNKKEEFFNREKEHEGLSLGSASIGHPMHPSQQQQQQQQQQNIRNFNSLNEEQHQQQQQQQQHNNKEAADNSHFIPPMLLVKSHYVPPASNKRGHNIEHEHEHEHHKRTHYLDATTEQQQQQHLIRNQTATDLNKTTMRTSTTTTTTTPVVTPTGLVLDLERPGSSSSSIKVIAGQPLKETEKHKNFENLENLQAALQTTTATAILHSSSVSFKQDDNGDDNGDDAGGDDTTVVPKPKPNDAIQELKPPQTLNADAETIATTELLVATAAEKSQKSYEKLYEFQTETMENKQQKMEILEPLTTTTTTKTTTQAIALQTFQPKITSQEENTYEEENRNAGTTMQIEEEKGKEEGKVEETTQANEITTTAITETALAKEAIQTETFENKPDKENDNDNDNKPVLITNKQQKQQQHKEQVHVHKEEDEEEKEIEKQEKETIVKTTEILATAEHKENIETEEEKLNPATVTTITPIITTTTATTTTTNNNRTPITTPATIAGTTTTTVKPITTTTPATITLPQNEVKSTETSVSSTATTTTTSSSSLRTTSASNNSPTANTAPPLTTIELAAAPITTTTTTTTTINDDTSSRTTFKISSTTSTTLQKQSQTDRETERETDSDTDTVSETTERATGTAMEIATQTLTPPPMPPSSSPSPSSSSSPTPETTRNFLKSTTEMPFKPNRRRSLTKPETVSYMKKILG